MVHFDKVTKLFNMRVRDKYFYGRVHMEEVIYKGKEYYMIKKNVFWVSGIILIIVMAMGLFRMYADAKAEFYENDYREYNEPIN